MATKISSSIALILALNLVLCNLALSASSSYPPIETCPKDTLKLNVCVDVLDDLINLRIASRKVQCCSLVGNLINLDAAACLCTAVHANILNILNLNLLVDLTLLVNQCGYTLPSGFDCPPRRA